ncbi:MAG: putative GTPase [Anaerocolumna sp.]|jgi:predicted GTPase/uncharacterized protein (DUF697 family)|nr:putative GTPase [Anaerocolumna sp.]
MKNMNRLSMEKRVRNISNLYLKVSELVNQLPDSVPENIKKLITEKILGDKELNELMESLDKHRPPRFLIIGRTGVGKSSLINAMCSSFLAETSAVEVGTIGVQKYDCIREGKIQMQILDTRGIGESFSEIEGTDTSAEKQLEKEIDKFLPDAILFVLPCASRDRLNTDVDMLNNILKKVMKGTPIIVVLNRADEIEPSQSDMTSERKMDNINASKSQVKKLLREANIPYTDIVAVSSYIDWGHSVEILKEMTGEQRENLVMDYDGRYNIDLLNDIIEKSLDDEAKTGFLVAAKLDYVLKKMANKFVNIFAGISSAVAITPIPLSDIYIITSIQIIMVVFIGALSGRNIDMKAAKEFILGVGGVSLSGLAFRTFAQQSSKLLNVVLPGVGSTVSSVVAFSGTKIIGNTAIDYFILEKDFSAVKKKFKKKEYSDKNSI